MKKVLVGVKDDLRGFVGGIYVEDTEATAYRSFDQLANSDAAIKFQSKDYAMYVLGSYDTELGVIEPCAPKLLVDAASCIRRKETVDNA